MSAILKIQNGGHSGGCANANIIFCKPYTLGIPKMHRFATLQKF